MAGKSASKRTGTVAVVDELGKQSGISGFFLLGLFLLVGVAFLGYLGRDNLGGPIILAALGVFASLGVFFLFALALGMIRFGGDKARSEFANQFVAEMESGIVVSDNDNRVLYCNRAYCDLIGASDIREVSSVEMVFAKRAEASEKIYKMTKSAREGFPATEEIRLDGSLDGSPDSSRWIRLDVQNTELAGYSKPLLVWRVSDVTDERLDQETAFQELQDAIHYLDHAPAGFIASEPEGTVAYMNATLADWLGVDLALFDPGSTNIREFIPDDNLALFDTANSEVAEAKTSVVDLDMKISSGHRLPVRLYHRSSVKLDGAPGTARTLVLNRSSNMDSDSALREAEVRFTRFFNNTPVAIAGLNGKGKVVRTNASFQKMFAGAISSAGGSKLKLENLVEDDYREPLNQLFDDALSGPLEHEPPEMMISGESDRFVRFYVGHVAEEGNDKGKDKSAERVIVYAVDTTEQRALENRFAKGQKLQAVGQLAGGIAHDFNNVLTAIVGFSDLLLANHKPSDPSFQDIMNIKQNANRAASLVRQLLAFSRRQTLRPQVLQMSDVLSDMRMLLDRLVGDRINLSFAHGRDLWPVKADVSQIEQVVVNLVVNARDAMDEEGALEIRTRNIDEATCQSEFDYPELQPADYVLIEVEDEGSGMSQEVLDKIFEPFFSTKEVGKGTGLGLSTVYGIVKQTGGFIYPESEVGTGTTFRLFLPRHIPDENEIAEEASPEKESAEPAKDLTGSASILLVEDEDAVRAFGSRALVSRGYEVHEASSGVEALEIIEEYGDEIDLVVSDVVMPEMDGPTLLKELRKTHPDLKFIFVSGYAEDAFAKNLPPEEQDKFGFLPKPFSLKQLATTVKEMLEQ